MNGRGVNRLLHRLGYSLQANRKTLEGRQHPDRKPAIPAHPPQDAGAAGIGAARRLGRHRVQDMNQGAALGRVAAFEVGDQLELGVAVGGGDSGNGFVVDSQGDAVGPQ